MHLFAPHLMALIDPRDGHVAVIRAITLTETEASVELMTLSRDGDGMRQVLHGTSSGMSQQFGVWVSIWAARGFVPVVEGATDLAARLSAAWKSNADDDEQSPRPAQG